MKAAVYYENEGPEVFRYENVADRARRRDGVVVDVEANSLEGGHAPPRPNAIHGLTAHRRIPVRRRRP